MNSGVGVSGVEGFKAAMLHSCSIRASTSKRKSQKDAKLMENIPPRRVLINISTNIRMGLFPKLNHPAATYFEVVPPLDKPLSPIFAHITGSDFIGLFYGL